MKRIAILEVSPISGNMGVQALAYSSYAVIDRILKKREADHVIEFLDIGLAPRTANLHLSDPAIPTHIRHLYRPLRLKSWTYILKTPRAFFRSLQYDYIFDLTGGDSFTDIYGDERFVNACRVKEFYARVCKSFVLLPQTIGPFREEHRARANRILRRVTNVFARDAQSLRYLAANDITTGVELIDMAFFLPHRPLPKFHSDGLCHIGINISALLWHGGYTQDNQYDLKADYREVTLKLIATFASMKHVKVHLISHVVSLADDIENDYAVCKSLCTGRHETCLRLAPLPFDPVEVKTYISRLDFFIGARMHACIAAFSTGVPCVPMSYSRKFNGLFCDTLNYPHVADLKQMDTEQVINLINRTFAARTTVRQQIGQTLKTTVEERKHTMVEAIEKILAS